MGINFKKTNTINTLRRTFKGLTPENIQFLIQQGFIIKNKK